MSEAVKIQKIVELPQVENKGEKKAERKRPTEIRDEYMQARYPWWTMVTDVIGDKGMVPTDRYWGQEFHGSYINRFWNMGSREPVFKADTPAEKEAAVRAKRQARFNLAKAEGVSVEDVVKQCYDIVPGDDELQKEDYLVEFFRDLKKSELNEQIKSETQDAKATEKRRDLEMQLEGGVNYLANFKLRLRLKVLKKLSYVPDKDGNTKCYAEIVEQMYADKALKPHVWKDSAKRPHFILDEKGKMWVHPLVYWYARHLEKGGGSCLDDVKRYAAEGVIPDIRENANAVETVKEDGSDIPF